MRKWVYEIPFGTSFEITGLKSGTAYNVRVGLWEKGTSNLVWAETTGRTLGAVRLSPAPRVSNLIAAAGAEKLTLAWTNPVGFLRASISLHVRWRERGTSAWTTRDRIPFGTTYEIAGLKGGATYAVEVGVLDKERGSINVWETTTATALLGVSLSASPNPVREGSPVTVTATLSRAVTEAVSVPVVVGQGSAEPGDFAHQGRSLDITIPAGQTTGTRQIATARDDDGDIEQFVVELDRWRMPPLLGEVTGRVRVTVVDLDADPHTVSVSDANGWEQINNYGRLCFAFTLSHAASHEIWVNYWTEDGTAKAGHDYTGVEPSNMAIPFEPGETRKRKCISIRDDNVEDSGETFFVVLANPHGAILGRARGTGTIYNHEPTSLSGLVAEGASDEEGPFTALDIGAFAPGTTAYAVTVPHGTTHARLTPKALNRYLTITTGLDGKGRSQVPFGGGTGPAVALAVGENVLVVKTQFNGQRQTYRLTIARQEAADATPEALQDAVSVTLSATPNPVDEGSPVTVTAMLATALAEAVTIPLTTTRGTSEDGDHGSLASITIPAGFTSATGTVSTVEDDDGDDETFTVALGSLPSGLTAGDPSSVRVTITDNRARQQQPLQQQRAEPLTARLRGTVTEHDGETPFMLELVLSESLEPGSRWPSAESFEVKGGSVERVRAFRPYRIHVHVKPKSWRDVTVTLAGGRACDEAGAVCTADGRALTNTSTMTIGGPVRIRIEGARAKEGKDASLDFAVTLDRAASHEVSVDYATEDGTATAGSDYTATSGTLVFAAGETAKTVSVPVLDDAIDEGKEVMRLLLSNPRGAYLRDIHKKARGIIVNDDALQQAWLSRFGRTVGGHVTDAVSGRLVDGLTPGAHVTLAGRSVDLTRTEDGKALADLLAVLAQRFGAPGGPAASDDDPLARHGHGVGWDASTTEASPSARAVTGRELLLGSAFHLAGAGDGAGPGLAVWGRVAHGSFDGEQASDTGRLRLDGEVVTGTLGADADWGRMLAGVAVSLSEGDSTFDDSGVTTGAKGRVESTMTTVSPYARLDLTERVSAWGLGVWGTGDMTIRFDDGTAPVGTDLSMRLGALGARGELLEQDDAGGMDLALRADAFFVRMESEKAANSAATEAGASRLRLVLEGGRSFDMGGGATLRPSLELGVRHDGGDAETGAGVELGGGVAFTDPSSGLGLEAKARMLVAHADSDYEEWGASATARLDPGERGRGFSFSLAPTIGATSSASERLWGAHDARALAPDGGAFDAGRGLQGEMGYGMPLFGGRFTGTPNLGFELADGGARDWRVGWRLASAGGGFEVKLDVARRETASADDAEHRVMLRGSVRW